MPTARKQNNKARKSREADMLSDIESMDIMLGSNHLESEESEIRNWPGDPKVQVTMN